MKRTQGPIKSFLFLCLLLIPAISVLSQDRTIRGTVTDNTGTPLLGVNVVVEETGKGSITDTEGRYSQAVSEGDQTLVFSFIGMETIRKSIGNSLVIDIVLEPSVIGMDEVVVVGYGTQKKSDITGTVASLPQERLEMVPNIDVTQAIQGSIPGVSITLTDAAAAPSNGNTSILIRGRNSIRASNAPLVIVDGIPYSGQLRDVNPNDIKSIEVLKDASSAAIYGSRGANGVILITTKGGELGKATIAYDGYFATQRFANVPDIMTGDEFYDFKMVRDPDAMTPSEQDIYDRAAWVNWPKEIMRMGYSHQHNLSVSGGSEKIKYYIAGNLLDVQGIAVNDDYQRLSSRVNIDAEINDWLTIGTRTGLSFDDRSGIDASFSSAFWMNPLTTAYNEDGTLTIYPWQEDTYFSNPLQGTLYENTNTAFQVISNNYLKIDIPFIKGLQYRLNLGIRQRFTDSGTYRGRNTKTGLENQGTSDISRWKYGNTTLENIVGYNRIFGNHSLGLTGVYSFEYNAQSSNKLHAEGYPHDVLTWYSAAQAEYVLPSYDYRETNLISQMFRANYGYDSRYLFTFTFRRDGFSGFGQETKWGNFPSAAIGWNIANEDFFSIDALNVLKLRASWGKNGNQAVGPYSTISRLRALDNIIDGQTAPGYVPYTLGADNLGWETTTSVNIGLDYGILENRITGDLNVYNSNTSDLLLERSISAVHGITQITQNIGKVNNKGIEFSINSRNVSTSNFMWSTVANFAVMKNKIVSLYGDVDSTGTEIDDIANKWFIGQPIGVNFGYEYTGVWQEDEEELATAHRTQPGFVKLLDFDGDTAISAVDRTIQGQTDPKFIWGMTNTVTYKEFTLSFFLQGVHGLTKENDLWSVDVWGEVRRNTVYREWWTTENPTNEIFMNHEEAHRQDGQSASRYENASFVRLKDLTLAYDLPEKLLERIRLKKLRLYFTGRNLMTFTSWTGLDPELDSQRAVPMSKEYVFGINVGF